MAEPREKRRSPRVLLVILPVLLGLYALAGFVLLPWWLEQEVPRRLEQHLGWQGSVDNVSFNPFAMSLEVNALQAEDDGDEPALGFQRLYVNLGIWQLVRGVTAFQRIALEEPFVRLDLLDDNQLNLVRDWQANNPALEPAEPSEEDPSSPPPRVYVESVSINGGELLLRDFTRGERKDFTVAPLDLSLNDLATWQREGDSSNYYLLAAMGSQIIEWEGDLSVTPLYSRGFLKIADLQHETLAHFLAPYLPGELRDGTLTVSSFYQFDARNGPALETSDGRVTLENLSLAVSEDSEESALLTERLEITDIGFSLLERAARIGPVTVEGLDLSLSRDARGDIDWLSALEELQAAGPEAVTDESDNTQASGSSPPFNWSVAGLELSDSRVHWQDQMPQEAADIEARNLSLTLGGVSHELDEPVGYRFGAELGAGGNLTLEGQVTPMPFTLEAAMSASEVALAQFQPYLGEVAELGIHEGRLELDGNLDLDSQDQPMTGTFSGTGQVAGLDLRLPEQDDPMVAWQSLRLERVEYNLAPARLEIGRVVLAEPWLDVVRGSDGVHNLERVMPGSPESPETAKAPEADTEQSPAEEQGGEDEGGENDGNGGPPGLIFRIGELLLENGAVAYTDRSMDPVFSSRIDQLSGTVSGISNVKPQQGRVNLSGRLGESSQLSIEGELGTLGTDESTHLVMTLDGYSMPGLSPYFGRYLGFGVDTGKLNLDLDYTIEGSRIAASNQVVMDRLELGQAVDSPEAVGAPVRLGLALLRDRQGVIELNLPISGDLSDPQFSVAQIVGRAFVNILTKAAASPFSMLGSVVDLAGFSAEELGHVTFPPGVTALEADESAKLEALSEALQERPALLLSVQGGVAPDVDEPALRRQALEEQLGVTGDMDTAQRISLLEQAYQQRVAEPPLANLEQSSEEDAGESREQTLMSHLLPTVQLAPEALDGLARSRAQALRRALVEDYGAPEEQLFLREPDRNAGTAEGGNVRVEFNLEPR